SNSFVSSCGGKLICSCHSNFFNDFFCRKRAFLINLSTLAASRNCNSLDSSASKYCLGCSNGISSYISAICARRRDLHIPFKSFIVPHLPQHLSFAAGHIWTNLYRKGDSLVPVVLRTDSLLTHKTVH